MSQMSRIREQASESEAVVRSITKDIQLLDLAKKNLMSSMTALKRFQMLGECVVASPREYDEQLRSSQCFESTGGTCSRQEICGDLTDTCRGYRTVYESYIF